MQKSNFKHPTMTGRDHDCALLQELPQLRGRMQDELSRLCFEMCSLTWCPQPLNAVGPASWHLAALSREVATRRLVRDTRTQERTAMYWSLKSHTGQGWEFWQLEVGSIPSERELAEASVQKPIKGKHHI